MYKLEKLKYVSIGCILSTVLMLGTSSVAADPITKNISAIYSNIKLYVDGVLINPKDANGEKVEPFTYNGTTYLPVRAIGDAVGKQVTWNEETQSVYLGLIPDKDNYLLNALLPYKYENIQLYKAEKGNTFSMAGQKYTNGFVMGNHSNKEIYFNLNGQYSEITGMLGTVEWENKNIRCFNIYLDGVLYKSIDVKPEDAPKELKINVKDVKQLKIISPYDSTGATNGETYLGFGDVKIK